MHGIKSDVRTAPDLPHHLYERDDVMTDMADFLIDEFMNRLSFSHKQHRMIYVTGGSRIGKSRIARELSRLSSSLIESRPHFAKLNVEEQKLLLNSLPSCEYIRLDFHNGDAFDRYLDHPDRSASIRMGARLAVCALFNIPLTNLIDSDIDLTDLQANIVLSKIIRQRLNELARIDSTRVAIFVINLDDFNVYVRAADKHGYY